MTFETATLPNGLRLIRTPGSSGIVYTGIVVDAGTRDELPEESGMAHLVEHMSFKGTLHRNAWGVMSRMETVGGDLNAFTGKEETVYYCAAREEHYARAIDLLLDITLRASFPERELRKEVEVVADEIESYNDSPSELIFDDYDKLIFPSHPLGRGILGDATLLRQYTHDDLHRFADRLYRPERMVLYLHGNVPMERIVATAERCMKDLTLPPACKPLPRLAPLITQQTGQHLLHKDTHQTHVLAGTRSCSAADERYLPLFLLNNILGGPAMTSRLNIALREHRGLVYTVESSNVSYTDTGVWNVYFGCDAHDVDRCLRLLSQELHRLCDSPLSTRTLTAAKRQLIGQTAIAHDNYESTAIGMGKRLLHYGTTLSEEQLFSRIEDLTPSSLLDTAQDILNPDNLTVLIYA